MKKKIVLALIYLAAYAAVIAFLRPSASGNVSITMNGAKYTMCKFPLAELMEDMYDLSSMTTTGKEVRFFNYSSSELEAKTEYNAGVPLRVKGAGGSQLQVWLYNPKPKPVGIREGMVSGVSCDIAELANHGITVEVSGLTIDGQSKEEIAAWAEQEMKRYKKTEGEDINTLSYEKGRGSYIFNFDDNDIVTKVILHQGV